MITALFAAFGAICYGVVGLWVALVTAPYYGWSSLLFGAAWPLTIFAFMFFPARR